MLLGYPQPVIRDSPAPWLAGSALLALITVGGCGHRRDLADPLERPVANTAYTVPGLQLDASVGGSGSTDMVARLGVSTQVGERAHVGTNLAHFGFGVANLAARVQLHHTEQLAVAADLGVLAARPAWMWYLPDEVREPLHDVTLINLPLGLTTTARVGDRLLLGVAGGYEHSQIRGHVDTQAVVFDGALGARRLWTRPSVHVLVGPVLLQGSFFLPLVSWAQVDADARVVVAPGVRAGLVSQEWTRLPIGRGYTWQLTGEARIGRVWLRGGVASNPVVRDFGVPLTPSLGLRWTL